MHFDNSSILVLLIFLFGSSCSDLIKNDITTHSDYVQNHNTRFIIGHDTIPIDYLWKSKNKKDTIYPYAVGEMGLNKLQSVSEYFFHNKYDTIIDIGLYAPSKKIDYRNWTLNVNEVINVGITYIRHDRLNFDFYNNPDSLSISFLGLSDGYCDTHNAFLLNESSVKNSPSLIKLKLNRKEVKRLKKPKLVDKSQDSLYNLVKAYGF